MTDHLENLPKKSVTERMYQYEKGIYRSNRR